MGNNKSSIYPLSGTEIVVQTHSIHIPHQLLTIDDHLMSILKLENDNLKCVDCGADNPLWVSLGFGVLICLKCAGFHRSLGVHITLVRSVQMDVWTEEHLGRLKMGGNRRFVDYLNQNIIEQFRDLNSKYSSPYTLYYREILDASINGTIPAPLNQQYIANVTPDVPPNSTKSSPPVWVPDRSVSACMICKESFTMMLRRHHCRRCGKCICRYCAPDNNTRPIIEWGMKQPVRHCKECYRSPIVNWTR